MQPPEWVCKQLYETHRFARLGWLGRPPVREDELNPGNFVVVQLYHYRDCGNPDNPKTARTFWDVETVFDHNLKEAYNVKIDRGPIFSRTGRPDQRDWDLHTRYPMMAAHVSAEDVFSGRFIYNMRLSMRKHADFKQDVRTVKKEAGKALQAERNELVETFSDLLSYEVKKLDHAVVNIAEKHQTRSLRQERDWTTFYDKRSV